MTEAPATATGRPGASGLASFLAALEARLGELNGKQVEAALLAHAERLVPRERESFIAIFVEPEPESDEAAALDDRGSPDPLLVEIDAFVERLRAGSYVNGWGWDDEIHDERSFGDESWVDEMDELFAAANAAFLGGEMALAGEALARLLGAFELEGEMQAFCGPDSPERMVSADVAEAKARYLRAVYETLPPSERPEALLKAIEELRFIGADASLAAIDETRRERLPELDAFLPAWIAHLGAIEADAQPDPLRNPGLARLLSEATELHRGADGLGELARSRGALDPEAHRDWVDALIRAERHGDAIEAARKALRTLDPRGETRAEIAERLARMAASMGDDDGALEARRQGWRAAPSTWRLIALIDIATALGSSDEVLTGEAQWASAPEHPGTEIANVSNDRLLTELLLLANRTEQALQLATAAEPLGWSRGDHPGPIVIPYLLVAATGGERRPELVIAAGSPYAQSARQPLLAQEFERIDRDGWVGADFDDCSAGLPLDERYRAIPADRRLPSFLLCTAIGARPRSQSEREGWLALAAELVEARVTAIVTAKHRRAYERAARLAVACGEAIALAHDQGEGFAFVIEARERFPRHHAFRAELDRACEESPYLPAPPRAKRR